MPSHKGGKGLGKKRDISKPVRYTAGGKPLRPSQVITASPAARKKAILTQVLAQVLYSMDADRTLTTGQAKGGFRPEVVSSLLSRRPIRKSAFRFASNPTKRGFKSGYHESFVVTDMTDHLSGRGKTKTSGLSQMPSMTEGFWKKYSGHTFPESNLSGVLSS